MKTPHLAPAALPFDEPTAKRVFELLDQRFYNQEQGMWPDDHPYGTCTYVNALPVAALTKAGHRCEMFGKDEEAFAGQAWDTKYHCVTGHDWLVVDDRWLVDFWIKPYLEVDRALYDLKNPTDQAEVEHLYGDRKEWQAAVPAHVEQRQLHPELFAQVLLELAGLGLGDEKLAMHALPCPDAATVPVKRSPDEIVPE